MVFFDINSCIKIDDKKFKVLVDNPRIIAGIEECVRLKNKN